MPLNEPLGFEIFEVPNGETYLVNLDTKVVVKMSGDDLPEINTPKKGKPVVPRRSLDAAFIAPTYEQAYHYVRALNYNPNHLVIATYKSYLTAFANIVSDEDFIVHVCGSWLDDEASENEKDDLREVLTYLNHRGFEIEKVNRLGKSKT